MAVFLLPGPTKEIQQETPEYPNNNFLLFIEIYNKC
jgi:hypothetical protein